MSWDSVVSAILILPQNGYEQRRILTGLTSAHTDNSSSPSSVHQTARRVAIHDLRTCCHGYWPACR
jgi:hypothetical protein